jgi:hypothetical protein
MDGAVRVVVNALANEGEPSSPCPCLPYLLDAAGSCTLCLQHKCKLYAGMHWDHPFVAITPGGYADVLKYESALEYCKSMGSGWSLPTWQQYRYLSYDELIGDDFPDGSYWYLEPDNWVTDRDGHTTKVLFRTEQGFKCVKNY